ncbi:hypothetical protein [Mycobacterium sp. 1274761.0]|uniref:hypothetical protein n=1 Tax=Mycobacterium sp. 1274761.0 TaxID=1834077 RepID=UPI0007FC8CA0|nr:hypothetical protein [Mycobacterium sp. 1274761.0]OBK72729.1 hypothetical protein A5651_15270 [Mycobacterium sp. 1274761.0]
MVTAARINYEQTGATVLEHFRDEVVLKLKLDNQIARRAGGDWVITARVLIKNNDDSPQVAEAKLAYTRPDEDGNQIPVEIDKLRLFIDKYATECLHLQTVYSNMSFEGHDYDDWVYLLCNTYRGWAESPSMIGISVEAITYENEP